MIIRPYELCISPLLAQFFSTLVFNKCIVMTKFLAGVIVGAVAGLLLAPEKGSEMREHIAETAEKWKEKWDRLMGNAGIELEDLKHVLEQEINGLSDDVRNRYSRSSKKAKTLLPISVMRWQRQRPDHGILNIYEAAHWPAQRSLLRVLQSSSAR